MKFQKRSQIIRDQDQPLVKSSCNPFSGFYFIFEQKLNIFTYQLTDRSNYNPGYSKIPGRQVPYN